MLLWDILSKPEIFPSGSQILHNRSRDFLGQPTQPEAQTVVWVLGLSPLTSPHTFFALFQEPCGVIMLPNPITSSSPGSHNPLPTSLTHQGSSQTEDLKKGSSQGHPGLYSSRLLHSPAPFLKWNWGRGKRVDSGLSV